MQKRILCLISKAVMLAVCSSSFPAVGAADTAHAADDEGNRRVKAELVGDREGFQFAAGDKQAGRIGIILRIEHGWHIYWRNSGEAAIPTRVNWRLPHGWTAGPLKWPAPLKFAEGGDITTFGYLDEVLLISDLHAPPEDPINKDLQVSADVSWLVCKDICVPGKKTLAKVFSYSEAEPPAPSKDWPAFEHYEALAPKTKDEAKLPFDVGAPVPERTSAAKGESISFGIPLSGLMPAQLSKLSKHVQFFPYEGKGLSALSASWTAASVPERGGSGAFTFPVEVRPDAEPIETLSGILVFSRALAGQMTDTALEWTTQVKTSATAGEPNAAYQALNPGDGESKRLSYRFKRPEEAAPTAPAAFSWTEFLTALVSAFAAGLLLNLMPCVLPILSIKALSIVDQSTRSRSEGLISAVFFVLGIIGSLLTLALIIIALKTYGMELGWGFQFQYPGFVYALLIIVFLLSLGLFDLYRFSVPFLSGAGRAVDDVAHPWTKNFFEGILTTALATPCTAPFLGTALAFAFTQSWQVTVVIFFAIGLGLGLPYLAIASSPRALALVPRPGPWMPVFKELMAFLLLGTAVWLLFILDRQLAGGALLGVLGAFWTFVCLWIYRTWLQKSSGTAGTLALIVLWAVCISAIWPKDGSIMYASRQAEGSAGLIDWKPFSSEMLDSPPENIVFLDFTADWCITCKANERLVLNTMAVAEAFKKHQVTAVRGDWTRGDEEVSRALRRFDANGVPLYVVIGPENTEVLPTLLTQSVVLDALKRAKRNVRQ